MGSISWETLRSCEDGVTDSELPAGRRQVGMALYEDSQPIKWRRVTDEILRGGKGSF